MAGTLVALVAAHNEEASIRATLLSLLRQERRADRIVVAVENCADGTLAIARSVPGVTVFETEANRAKNRVADGPRRGPVEVRFNRLTRFDWWQQLHGVLAVLIRSAWIVLLVAGVVMGTLQLQPLWLIPPALFLANDVKQSFPDPPPHAGRRGRGGTALAPGALPLHAGGVIP